MRSIQLLGPAVIIALGCSSPQPRNPSPIPRILNTAALVKPTPPQPVDPPPDAPSFQPFSFEDGACFGLVAEEPCPASGILVSEVFAMQAMADKAAAKRLLVEAEQNYAVAVSLQDYTSALTKWADEASRTPDPGWFENNRGTLG